MSTKFKTYDLAEKLFKECKKIKTQAYIRDQMMRAALSVVLNLQEGAAKLSEKDRRRFYNIAYGSVKEVQAVLRLLDLQEQFKLADQVGACIYRLQHPKPPT